MKKTLQTIKKAGIYSAFFGVSLMSAQTTYTFTNAGATGRSGPTLIQTNAAYLATNLSGSVSVIGSGIQEFTVPITGLYKIKATGASGGIASTGGFQPGYAASMEGDFILNAGDVLRILVGQMGQDRLYSGGGGGGTFVTKTPHNTTPSILVIAGGGGASSADFAGISASTGTCGTFDASSGPAQCNGDGGLSFSGNSGSGGGGFFTDGQNGGIGNGGLSYILGGQGGTTSNQQEGGFGGGGGQNGTGTYAASGGGGFSGGNGGNRGSLIGTGRMGGGGGGSFNNGINQVNSLLSSTGMGQVIITSLYSVNISQTSTISCNGNTTAALSTTVNGGVGPYTYTWAPTGGNAATASALAAGVYTCFVTDALSLLTSSTFTVSQPAVLATSVLSQTNVTCNAGTNGALTVTVTGGTAPYSYTWSPTGGSTASATGLVANNYTCVVRDANGCPIAQTTGTITQPASFSITATVTNSLICGAGSTTLTASGAFTYTWTGGVTNGATFTPTVSNSYTVTAKNGAGCLASNSPVLTVNVGSIPTVSVTSGVICSGQSFTLVASGASTYNYTGGSAVVTPTANMSYSVTGTSSVGCVSSNTAVSTVTVNANPTISASASSAVICAGEATTLSATASSTTYTWNTGATTASLSVSPTTTTNYTVTTTGTNGCTAAANVNVTVNACTGINEVTASLISVYPNPNNGIVNITLTTALAQNSTLEIYDALGKLVVKQVLANELNSVNMSNLDNGIYVFKVLNNNNTVKIGKLIKQ